MAEFADKKLVCKDCNAEFVFSVREQEYHQRMGLRNEPRRCLICRQVARMRNDDKALTRGPRRSGPPGPGGPRPGFSGPRETFTVTCAGCGRPADVPFKPTGARPVYCRDCFRSRR
jgi:CxxC-x17-CxxC domain-containing protein